MTYALIESAVVGDRATIPGARAQFIRSRCEGTASDQLACLSCRQPLANLTQLTWHLEAHPEQTHVIARRCLEHGWETL